MQTCLDACMCVSIVCMYVKMWNTFHSRHPMDGHDRVGIRCSHMLGLVAAREITADEANQSMSHVERWKRTKCAETRDFLE
eukprot:m.994431 g.994431  ORF g.994431 m.994431 type:complete len:81 (+) comp24012_c1_seq56:1897-2139(+)